MTFLELAAIIASALLQTRPTENYFSIFAAGGDCTAYDVIVHPDFLERAKPRFLLQQFFLTLVLEGIANKYNLDLSMSALLFYSFLFC